MGKARWSRFGGRNRFGKETRVPFCSTGMSVRHPNGDSEWAVGYVRLEVREEEESSSLKENLHS